MNLLFTICARAGSKGLANKNIKVLNGYPLVYYTIAAYQLFRDQYQGTDTCIELAVNSDSQLLFEQINTLNIPYMRIDRAEELSGDRVSKYDVIANTLEVAEDRCKKIYDVVIDLDLTSPIRTVADVKGTLDALLIDEKFDISYSVTNARRSPYFNMVCFKENSYYDTVIESEFVARQQAPVCYDMNASIYAYKRDYLKEKKISVRKRANIWIMPDNAILDIDSEDDFFFLEVIEERLSERLAGYKIIKERVIDYARYVDRKGWEQQTL